MSEENYSYDSEYRGDAPDMPYSTLDLQNQLIEPTYQTPKEKFINALSEKKYVEGTDKDGAKVVFNIRADLSNVLAIYTKDLRLGYLTKQEYMYVSHYMRLAGDVLSFEPVLGLKPVISCLNRVLSVNEPSTGRSGEGNLRKLLQTINKRYESIEEPKKESLLGGKK